MKIGMPSLPTSPERWPTIRAPGDPVISVDTKKKELIGDFTPVA